MPASDSLRLGGLPIGLAHHVTLRRAVPTGKPLTWQDVAVDESAEAVRVRREMEAMFAAEAGLTRNAADQRDQALPVHSPRPL